jgi:hypothetical protein
LFCIVGSRLRSDEWMSFGFCAFTGEFAFQEPCPARFFYFGYG